MIAAIALHISERLRTKTTTLDGRNVNMASITNMDVAVSLARTPQRLAKPRVFQAVMK